MRRVKLKAVDPASTRSRFREGTDSMLAIEPRAFGWLFELKEQQCEPEIVDGVAIVRIEGPLEQRAGWLWDGYDAIRERFEMAVESEADTVLLLIDSPGGDVAGLFDAVRAMRAAATASKKKVVAFADEGAFSAAYALATVADEIYVPATGGVGSIGVIATVYDVTAMDERLGINAVVIRSGDEKGDGHPHIPLSAETIARFQTRVDTLAEMFAELVTEKRGGSPEKWLSLQGGVRYGTDAVANKLADGVKSCDELLAELRTAEQGTPKAPAGFQGNKPMNIAQLQAALDAAQKAGNQAEVRRLSIELGKAKAALQAGPAAEAEEEADEDEEADDEESEDSEESEDDEAEDDADDDEGDDEEDDEDEGDGDEDADDDEAEDEADDDGKKSKYKKAEAGRIARVAAQLTGKNNAAEIIGTLRGMAAMAREGKKASARLSKIEGRLRRADVDKLIARGMKERKITPASKAHFEKIGMRSTRELKAMLKVMSPVVSKSAIEKTAVDAQGNPTTIEGQVASKLGVTPEQMASAAARSGQTPNFPKN